MDWFEILIKVPQGLCEQASAIANMIVPYGIYVEDYSDLAGYHFASDIAGIYKFVSPLCSISVINDKAGKKK